MILCACGKRATDVIRDEHRHVNGVRHVRRVHVIYCATCKAGHERVTPWRATETTAGPMHGHPGVELL